MAGGNVISDVIRFKISPADSSRVVYVAQQDTDGDYEIYSVPITGGTATKLNTTLAPGGDVSFESFFISPNNNTVIYLADQDTNGTNELFSVAIGGRAVTKLNASPCYRRVMSAGR
jgi:Tol biopolymer transport system component